MGTPRRAPAAWLLVALGLVLTGLLVDRTLALAAGSGAEGFDACSALLGGDCDATLAGEDAAWWGIPWSAWGLGLYVGLLALLALGAAKGGVFSPAVDLAACLVAALAATVGAWLGLRLLLRGGPTCALCLATHAVTLLLAGVLWARLGMRPREALAHLRTAWGIAVGARAYRGRGSPAVVAGLVLALLAGLVAVQRVEREYAVRRAEGGGVLDLAAVVARHEAQPVVRLEIRDDDPRLGPTDARAQVVVFSSLQCPGCRQALALLEELRHELGDRLSVVFKHFPLGTACNPHVDGDRHPRACGAARAAEAARLQGTFWVFHDAVLEHGVEGGPASYARTAEGLGLDMTRFATDVASDAVARRIAEDVAQGGRLRLAGTPAIFLGGRLVEAQRLDAIRHLVRRAAGAP